MFPPLFFLVGFVESWFPVFMWSFWEELAIWPSDLDETSKNDLALKSQTWRNRVRTVISSSLTFQRAFLEVSSDTVFSDILHLIGLYMNTFPTQIWCIYTSPEEYEIRGSEPSEVTKWSMPFSIESRRGWPVLANKKRGKYGPLQTLY